MRGREGLASNVSSTTMKAAKVIQIAVAALLFCVFIAMTCCVVIHGTSNIIWVGFLMGSLVFSFAAFAVWAFRIQQYVDRHGGSAACVLFTWAPWRDYRTACRIAERTGRKPKFLTWFKGFYVASLAFLVAALLTTLLAK